MKKHLLTLAASTVFALLPFTASASDQDSFTGSVSLGAIFIDSANNLNPNGSDRRLETLEEAPDRNSSGIAVLLPRLTWHTGESDRLQFYLDTDPPIDEVGGFSFNLGTRYTFQEIGTLDTALFFTPFEEAWEDPYITDEDREETDTSKYGIRAGLNRIFGSGLRANLVYMFTDVDNDLIGSRIPELRRDGSILSLNINYSFYPSKNIEIRPRVSVRKGDYDGDANSFLKYKADLEARLKFGKIMVIPRIFYSYKEYDEVHPVFGVQRDDDGYGMSLVTTYMAPFNFRDWSVTALLSLSRGQSNIDFYDTEALTAGGFLTYHF